MKNCAIFLHYGMFFNIKLLVLIEKKKNYKSIIKFTRKYRKYYKMFKPERICHTSSSGQKVWPTLEKCHVCLKHP